MSLDALLGNAHRSHSDGASEQPLVDILPTAQSGPA